jgi:hypothetical protein
MLMYGLKIIYICEPRKVHAPTQKLYTRCTKSESRLVESGTIEKDVHNSVENYNFGYTRLVNGITFYVLHHAV